MLSAATPATIVPYMCIQEAFFSVDRCADKLAAETIHWLANNSIGCLKNSLFAAETMNDCSDSTVLSRLTVLTWPASSLVFLSAFQKRMCLLYKACGTKWAYPLWRMVQGSAFPPNSSWVKCFGRHSGTRPNTLHGYLAHKKQPSPRNLQ